MLRSLCIIIIISIFSFAQNSPSPTAGILDGRAFGMICNGVIDDTGSLNSAIQTAYSNNGGTIVIPETGKACFIPGQVTLPNDGTVPQPFQPSIRIRGAAASGGTIPGLPPLQFGTGPAWGGSVLNMTNNSATAKIDTRGIGPFELDHLTIMDTSSDCSPFLFTSNTIVHIHDVTFLGTAVGSSACNDAIILGNNNGTPSGSFNAPFQGYGSVIEHNFFQKVKRAVLGQAFANSIVVEGNTIWSASGNPSGGAIEFGSSAGAAMGNMVSNNLIETVSYKYGVRFVNSSSNNKAVGNDCFDGPFGQFANCVRFESGSTFNIVSGGLVAPNGQPYLSDSGNNNQTFISGAAGSMNIVGNPIAVELTATLALTIGQVVKLDTSNQNSVLVTTTTDTGAGVVAGIVSNSPVAGDSAIVITFGKLVSGQGSAPLLGSGTCSIGQFIYVDTVTNGRVKCSATASAGRIGQALSNQSVVGSPVGILLTLGF